jgi:hypothetical protein
MVLLDATLTTGSAMREDIKRDYAEMFITMSYDYLRGGITWETFILNIEIAVKSMRSAEAPSKDAHCELETRKEDGP